MTRRPIFTDRCVTTLIGKVTSANFSDIRATEMLPRFLPYIHCRRRAAPRLREKPHRLDFCAFCKGYSVVNIDPKITNGILDV